jgi:hypothetical protein
MEAAEAVHTNGRGSAFRSASIEAPLDFAGLEHWAESLGQ